MIYLLSSLPPSVNALYYSKGKHRYKTPEYNLWLMRTMRELKRAPAVNFKKVSCTFNIPYWSHKTAGDVINYEKALVDVLVKSRLIPDDKHCVEGRTRWVVSTKSGAIEADVQDMTAYFHEMEDYEKMQ